MTEMAQIDENLLPVKLDELSKDYFSANLNETEAWLNLPVAETPETLEYFSKRLNKAREFKLGKATDDHFVTDFHRLTYLQLARMCRVLCMGSYKNKTGTFTKVLPGPRGVANTTCLKNFASAAPLLGSSVISYFFSVSSANSGSPKVLEAGSLCGLVMSELFNVSQTPGRDAKQDALVHTLEKENLKLVLLVDEVDQLFKAKESNHAFYGFASKSLGELAALGNSTCGRFIIVLSGSSRLITYIKGTRADLSTSELAEFPILSEQLNMNNNRFKSLSVALPRPDSIENALAILHPSQTLTRQTNFCEEQLRDARKRMFVDGCNPRNLDDNIESISTDILPSNHVCRKLWTQLLFLWFGQRDNRRLLVELGRRSQNWRERWRHGRWRPFRCTECERDASKCEHAIERHAWEGKFKPVSMAAMYRLRGPELQCEVETLQYEGHLLMIQEDIFPVSLKKFEENLKAWAPSFKELLARRCVSFCSSPLDQVETFDNLSSAAKELVKEAIIAGISHGG